MLSFASAQTLAENGSNPWRDQIETGGSLQRLPIVRSTDDVSSDRRKYTDANCEAFRGQPESPLQRIQTKVKLNRVPRRFSSVRPSTIGYGKHPADVPAIQQAAYFDEVQTLHQESLHITPPTIRASPPVPAPTRSTSEELPQTETLMWSFSFRKAPWSTVLREFSSLMGYSLTMRVEPPGEFNFYDERPYSATAAIDVFNDHLIPDGFVLVRKEDRLVLLNSQEPIDDRYVPFVDVNQIDLLSRNEIAGAAISVFGQDIDKVFSEVEGIKSPLGQLKLFSHSNRILAIDTGTHLRRIRDLLMHKGFARSDISIQVYPLHHSKAEDVAKAVNDFLNPQNSSGSRTLLGFAPEMVHVTPELATNSLLIRGPDEAVEMMYHLVAQLDRAPREVLLQALIVEVQRGNTLETGVEIGFQDSVLFDRFEVASRDHVH